MKNLLLFVLWVINFCLYSQKRVEWVRMDCPKESSISRLAYSHKLKELIAINPLNEIFISNDFGFTWKPSNGIIAAVNVEDYFDNYGDEFIYSFTGILFEWVDGYVYYYGNDDVIYKYLGEGVWSRYENDLCNYNFCKYFISNSYFSKVDNFCKTKDYKGPNIDIGIFKELRIVSLYGDKIFLTYENENRVNDLFEYSNTTGLVNISKLDSLPTSYTKFYYENSNWEIICFGDTIVAKCKLKSIISYNKGNSWKEFNYEVRNDGLKFLKQKMMIYYDSSNADLLRFISSELTNNVKYNSSEIKYLKEALEYSRIIKISDEECILHSYSSNIHIKLGFKYSDIILHEYRSNVQALLILNKDSLILQVGKRFYLQDKEKKKWSVLDSNLTIESFAYEDDYRSEKIFKLCHDKRSLISKGDSFYLYDKKNRIINVFYLSSLEITFPILLIDKWLYWTCAKDSVFNNDCLFMGSPDFGKTKFIIDSVHSNLHISTGYFSMKNKLVKYYGFGAKLQYRTIKKNAIVDSLIVGTLESRFESPPFFHYIQLS